ncbi:MAG: TerC/Alx family metal homeostasis membrane protein [Gemmatimonadota bacterium]|nr:MAG: TerC/Alx family metal homeostasis membrane protein [Gemmatimonadota bacterium]
MLALDLGLHRRYGDALDVRTAVLWSLGWIALALGYAGLVLALRGTTPAVYFVTAYVVEKSLSVDNIFVFLIIFGYFGVPPRYQHRVLLWGVLSVVVLRGVFIAAGVAAIHRLEWLTYVLGAFLVYTGVQVARGKHDRPDPGGNPVVRFLGRRLRVTDDFEGARFFVVRRGRYYATPLFIVLMAIETTDLVFAVDSVPAVLAITTDPLIAFTSNIFAVAGLRALYFALAGLLPRLRYLHHALAAILMLVGVKMLAAEWYHPPTGVTLAVVALILAAAVVLSLRRLPPRPEKR